MKPRVATVTGVMVKPGVSQNGRLYTPEHVHEAVADMQARIESGNAPLMLEAHPSPEDGPIQKARAIVGNITKAWVDEADQGRFSADLADTEGGRDIAVLTKYGAKPSIRGNWTGAPRVVIHEGQRVVTGDGLHIEGVDWTRKPGVEGATVDATEHHESAPPLTAVITESVDDLLVEADKTPYGDVTYADPGYQKDKVKRYPLDTAAHVKAAWSYINMPKNAAKYSDSQVATIKSKIKAAAKKVGVDIKESWTTEEMGELLEAMSPGDAYGHTRIPLDPDGDGDIDGWLCPTCGGVEQETNTMLNPDGDSGMEATPPKETHPVTESATTTPPTTPPAPTAPAAAPAAPARNLTEADVAAVVAALKGETPAAPAPVTEATPATPQTEPLTEAAQQRAALKAEVTKEVIGDVTQFLRENRILPQRKGLVRVTESADKEIDLRTPMSDEEFRASRGDLATHLLGTGAPEPA